MRDQTEFLAEIYARYEKNKRIRNKKYIKTAVSFCLFAILGAAALPILSQPKKSAEAEHFSNAPNSATQIESATNGSKNPTYSSEGLEYSIDFGTDESTEESTAESMTAAGSAAKDSNAYYIESEGKAFIYPFSAEEISAVIVRNGKGQTYTLLSEKNISVFYDYFRRNRIYFIHASQAVRDTNETYTVEFRCYIGESKVFYVKGLEKNVLSLMKALQENE